MGPRGKIIEVVTNKSYPPDAPSSTLTKNLDNDLAIPLQIIGFDLQPDSINIYY